MTVEATAPAKLNLTLDVVGKRADGYHLLRTVMQSIDLADTVTVSLCEGSDILLTCDGNIPADTQNTAYRAADVFRKNAGIPAQGIAVTVEKHIPSQAGLAGGSADAAAVLLALNVLLKTNYPVETLCEWGALIGADVPFCVRGGTALCTGIGDNVSPQSPLRDCAFVIVKPEGGVSTPEAYRLLDTAVNLLHPDSDALCRALSVHDLRNVAASIGNAFEIPLALPFTETIANALCEHGALCAALTGSGSAVFGLFADETAAHDAAAFLSETFPETWVCRPCGGVTLKILE